MIILITGASKGIGRYLAEYYLNKGNTVIGFSRSNSDIQNDSYFHYNVDVTDEKGVMKALGEVRKKFEYIDCLINNAGIASMNHIILTPMETAHKLFNVNFFGTFLMTRECAKLLRKSGNPRIVNFSTVAHPLKLEGEAVYAASKAAIVSFTQISAKELAEWKITVNSIGPVPVKTDLIAGVPKDKMERLLNSQTIKRFGVMEDISNVIDFFIRPESNFITGQVIYLGGVS